MLLLKAVGVALTVYALMFVWNCALERQYNLCGETYCAE